MGKGFFDCRGAIHLQAVSSESFLKKHAYAFFIVENEDRPAFQNAGRGTNCFGGRGASLRGSGGRFRRRSHCDGKVNGESRTSSGKGFRFNVPAMLANDGHADAEAEARAASRALGGVERIEYPRERLRADAHAIILDGDGDAVRIAREADLNAAGVADFADGLFRIGDQIQKNLDELVGVADDRGKSGFGMEINIDVVAA